MEIGLTQNKREPIGANPNPRGPVPYYEFYLKDTELTLNIETDIRAPKGRPTTTESSGQRLHSHIDITL